MLTIGGKCQLAAFFETYRNGAALLALHMDPDKVLTLPIAGKLQAGRRSWFAKTVWGGKSHGCFAIALNENDAVIMLLDSVITWIELLSGDYEWKWDVDLQNLTGRCGQDCCGKHKAAQGTDRSKQFHVFVFLLW